MLPELQILLVEDADDVREVFCMLLEAEGADVVAVGTGREAIQAALVREFDVVLTDLGLPDLAGDAVIRHVRAVARRRPKVIVVTGYGEPFIGRARQAGADVILTKPVSWSSLLGHLASGRRAPVAA